jgi:2-amino-4-hydroxy-6-hydroxymethyldihydropteridine diphosphokinase
MATSSVHATRPVGEQAGSTFLNAAVRVNTRQPPLDLLDFLQTVESKLGRTRGIHWGPRTLDIDLIFYGDAIIEEQRLHVPHPACWYRRFVLDPLVEIAADFMHPVKRLTVHELRERLLQRPLQMALCGGEKSLRAGILKHLSTEFPDVQIFEWNAGTAQTSSKPTFLAWLGPAKPVSNRPSRPGNSPDDEIRFEALPLVPRLDVSNEHDPQVFLHDVLRAALGA